MYRMKLLIAMKLCSIVLLTPSASAQTATAPTKEKTPPPHTREGEITPRPVPEKIQVRPESVAFFKGHGVGTQNYVCRRTDSGFASALFTPQATLFNSNG